MEKGTLRFLTKLVLFVISVYIVLGVVFGVTTASNDDMKPAIRADDIVFYCRMSKLRAGDTVVYTAEGGKCVGRIVAVGGDSVVTENDSIRVNGSTLIEQNIYYPTVTVAKAEYCLENGEYFILGDFRTNAKDSRLYGVIGKDCIKGKVITVIRQNNI